MPHGPADRAIVKFLGGEGLEGIPVSHGTNPTGRRGAAGASSPAVQAPGPAAARPAVARAAPAGPGTGRPAAPEPAAQPAAGPPQVAARPGSRGAGPGAGVLPRTGVLRGGGTLGRPGPGAAGSGARGP